MESEKKVSIDATPLNDNNTERRKRKVPKVNKKKDAPEVPIFLKVRSPPAVPLPHARFSSFCTYALAHAYCIEAKKSGI